MIHLSFPPPSSSPLPSAPYHRKRALSNSGAPSMLRKWISIEDTKTTMIHMRNRGMTGGEQHTSDGKLEAIEGNPLIDTRTGRDAFKTPLARRLNEGIGRPGVLFVCRINGAASHWMMPVKLKLPFCTPPLIMPTFNAEGVSSNCCEYRVKRCRSKYPPMPPSPTPRGGRNPCAHPSRFCEYQTIWYVIPRAREGEMTVDDDQQERMWK